MLFNIFNRAHCHNKVVKTPNVHCIRVCKPNVSFIKNSTAPQRVPVASPSAHNISSSTATDRTNFPRGVASRSTFHAGQQRATRDQHASAYNGPPASPSLSHGNSQARRPGASGIFSKFTSKFVRRWEKRANLRLGLRLIIWKQACCLFFYGVALTSQYSWSCTFYIEWPCENSRLKDVCIIKQEWDSQKESHAAQPHLLQECSGSCYQKRNINLQKSSVSTSTFTLYVVSYGEQWRFVDERPYSIDPISRHGSLQC